MAGSCPGVEGGRKKGRKEGRKEGRGKQRKGRESRETVSERRKGGGVYIVFSSY